MFLSSAAPGVAAAVATLGDATPATLAPQTPADFASAYAHQLAFLQNPIVDPGFALGAPLWTGSSGTTIDGAAHLVAGSTVSQDLLAASDGGVGAFGAASPFVGAEALAFRASGNGTVTLQFVEQATGQVFTALSASFTDANGALRFPIAQTPRLAQSSPRALSFAGGLGGATIDDVVLEGVEYGDPSLPVQLDDPLPADAQRAIESLEAAAAELGVPLSLTPLIESGDYAHDGYSLVVLPLDFTPAAGGVNGALASPADFATHPGSWRFAVYLVEYGPSGTTLLSADSLGDARLLLNATPSLAASGAPAAPRQLLALADTPYAGLVPFDAEDLDARGVVFRTNEIALEDVNLIAVWNSPADEGGLYAETDVRGFFHPAKLALGELPVADALDVVTLPLAAFGIGAVPCAGADGLTYRFGDLDCDAWSDLDEIECWVQPDNTIAPLSPDPLDATRNCDDPDGDGLIGDYDPQPLVTGTLKVTIRPDANGAWWSGQRALDFTLNNTYNGDNTQTDLDVRLAVIFQTEEDVDFDGQRVDCEGPTLSITADGLVNDTCYFDTTVPTEGADYRVILLAEILQPPYPTPRSGDDLGRLVGLDNTPPGETDLVITGDAGDNGWHTSTVNVAFDPTDALSGVDHVRCALGGATPAPCPDATIMLAGQTDLTYYAVDKAGNAEPTNVASFFLSLTDPVVTCAATTAPLGENGWHLSAFDVACSATGDAPTRSIRFQGAGYPDSGYTDPIPIATAGDHTIVAAATDAAGRTSASRSFPAPLDLAAPDTTLDIVGDLVGGSLYSSALDIGFDVVDDASGLARTLVSVDGAAPQSLAPGARLALSAEGTHTISFRSVDRAGRFEDATTRTLVIDRTAPETIGSITGTLGANGWYRSNLLVALTSTDDGSGVSGIEYNLDGVGPLPYSGPIDVTGDGHHELVFYALDNAGNPEAAHTLPLDIDTTPPLVTLSFVGTTGEGSWYLGNVVANVTATDALSGVDEVFYLQGSSGYGPYNGNSTISDQGLTAVAAYATDEAGNAAPVQSTQVKIDNVDPVTTVTLDGPEAANGWFDGSVEVTLAASDPVSGVSRIDYALDDGDFIAYTAPFTVSGDLAHELRTRALDVAGNTENNVLTLVPIDTVDPNATTLDVAGTLGGGSWYRSATTLTFTPSDATSGIDVLRVSTNGGSSYANHSGEGPHAITLDASGTYALAWQSRDLSGRTEAAQTGSVKLDLVAPTTTAELAGLSEVAPWINVAPATLTLTAVDPGVPTSGSGVALTQYRVDNGTWTNYTGPVEFNADGVFDVDYRSTDVAGNVEAEKRLVVRVDTTAPTVTSYLTGTQIVPPWYTSAVVVQLNASDATSGATAINYTLGGTSFLGGNPTVLVLGAQGANTVDFFGIDAAGNDGALDSTTFYVDAFTPETNVSLAGTLGSNGYFTSGVTVTLTNASGPSGATTEYRIGEGAPQAYTGPFVIGTQGTTIVQFRSTSGAGLVEAWRTATIRIDLDAPTTGHSLAGDNVSAAYYRSNVTVTLLPADAISQVASTEYSIDGAPFVAYEDPFEIAELGTTTVAFRSTDNAGLIEATQSIDILVDWSAPVTTPTLVGLGGNDGWFRGPVEVTLATTTGPSGSHSTRYAIDDDPLALYGAPFNVTGDAMHTVRFTGRSNADVNESLKSISVNVDATVPFTTLVATGDQVNEDYYVSLVTLNLSAIDNMSGVDSIEYRVNGGNWTTYEGPVTPALNGSIVFEYRATDVAGNTETARSFTYFVDLDAPISTLALAGTSGENGWYVSNVTATLTATTGPSGLDRIDWRDNGGMFASYTDAIIFSGNGQHLFEHRAVSNAGLVEPTRNASFKIDTVAPVTTITLLGELGDNGFFTSGVDIELSVLETTSGLNRTRYQLDGGAWTDYADAIPVSASGTHTILVESRDNAGNVEIAHERSFKIDVDEIVTTITPAGVQGDEGWFIGPVTITLTAEGGPSNISLTEAKIDTGPFFDYNATPFVLDSDGLRGVAARSTNGAGVLETPTRTLQVKIDQLAPSTTHTLTPVDGLAGWHTTAVAFTLTATDATSGVRTIQFRQNGGEWTNVSGNTTTQLIGGSGYHTIEYRATDHAGLVEAIESFSFKIDAQPVVSTSNVTGTLGANGWYTSTAILNLTAVAGPSNVSAIHYTGAGATNETYVANLGLGDGRYSITYHAVNGAGVAEAPRTLSIDVDTLAPSTNIDVNGTLNASWYTTPVAVTLTPSDAMSGLALTECSIDGAAFSECDLEFTIGKQGLTTIAVRSTDVAGNLEAEHNVSFTIDTVGPIVSIATSGAQVNAPWYTTNVSVVATAADPAPGSDGVQILVNNALHSGSFEVATDGDSTYTFQARDAAGNHGPIVTRTFQVDRVVPTTSAAVNATAGNAGWLVSNAIVTLTNATGPSGAASTSYTLDGGSSPYGGPIPVSGEGNHTLTFATTSVAGLVESTKTLTLRIDTVDPTVELVANGTQGENGWFLSAVDVTLVSDDATSGVADCEWAIEGGASSNGSSFSILADGVYEISYRCTDVAGNVGDLQHETIKIDTVDPTISGAITAGTLGDAGYYVTPVTVSFTTVEATSGVATIYAARNGGGFVAVSNATRVVSEQGETNLTYYVEDNAGRVSAISFVTMKVDSILPAADVTLSGTVGDDSWYTSAVTADVVATDGGSGVTGRTYSLDGSADFPCGCPVTVSSSGIHTINATARDAAGNVGTKNDVRVKIDTVAPTTVASVSGTLGQNNWFISPVTIAFSASDDLSQVRHVLVSVDNGNYTPVTGSVTIDTDGAHTVRFRAQDNAGNLEAVQSRSFNIDTTAPTPSADLTGTPGNAGWYRSAVTVALSGTDATSGSPQLRYRLNGGSELAYSAPFQIASEGETTLSIRAIDAAGISSATQTTTLFIDTQTPTASHVLMGAQGTQGWYTSAVSIDLAATDPTPGSGATAPRFSLDGSAPAQFTSSILVPGEGQHALSYAVGDVAGNLGSTRNVSFAIDTTKPVVVISATPQDGAIYTTNVVVEVTASDATSGVQSREYSLNGMTWLPYTGAITVSTTGNHTVYARATDKAGLVSDVKSVSFAIDKVEPTLTLSPYRINVLTATPTVSAVFGPVFAGWNATRATLTVDGQAAPHCTTSTAAGSLTISCTPIAWTEAFAAGGHTAIACATTSANKVWCSDVLLPATSKLPWTFTVNPDDWDRDTHPNNRETRYNSLPYNPYSVPSDPQGWNLRQTPNDPESALLASDSQGNLSQAQSFVKINFAQFVYASPPSESFAPNRTAVPASLDRLAIMEAVPVTSPSIGLRAGANEAASVTLGASETVIRIGNLAPIVLPVRAIVSYEPGVTTGAIGLELRAAGNPVADIDVVDGAISATIYGPNGAPLARYPPVDADGDQFFDEIELALGSDPLDGTDTPVPRTDVGDDYAVVMKPIGPAVPVAGVAPEGDSQPVILFSTSGTFPVRLHVDDFQAGGRVPLEGKRLEFAVLRLSAAQAYLPQEGGEAGVFDTGALSLDGRDPTGAADWTIACDIGVDCAEVEYATEGDDTIIVVQIPSNRVALGPYLLWARVGVDDRAGIDSAAGFYAAPKAALHDAPTENDETMLVEEAQDHTATPVILVVVPEGSVLGGNMDGDDYTDSEEIGFDTSRGSGSDPMDATSTPETDDDGDGCLNRDEAVPSWILPTPQTACAAPGLRQVG